MSFIITYYPWGSAPSIFTANGEQHGTLTTVPADGSATVAVTFPLAYASSVYGVWPSIDATTRIAEDELTVQVSNVTLTGFVIYVAGGLTGSTVTVYWRSEGQ